MVFSSLVFLFFFLPIFLFVYFIVPKIIRNLVLLTFSLIFYAWGEPIYITIMLFSTVFDYSIGRVMDYFKHHFVFKKGILILSIIVNVSLLGFFKYTNFFIQNTNTLFDLNFQMLEIALPIGISFYTFQTMSYTIDLYRGKVKVQKNFLAFATYVSMFPQLIAGPIVTYDKVEKELAKRTVTLPMFGEGCIRFIEGLGKKVLLANNIGLLWSQVQTSEISEISVMTAWLGIIAFSLQIYFDFSGYSDMAIGLGKMIGFDFPENFHYPYVSKSVTEFWRRWHITLGSWFREYVYIPLGGNRVSKANWFRNIVIVWLLTGFWHGASWNFIIWGLYFAVFLIIEKQFLSFFLNKLPTFFSHSYLLIVVLFSWVLFSFEQTQEMFQFIKTMFHLNNNRFIDKQALYYITNYFIIFVIAILFSTPIMVKWKNKINAILLYIYYVMILVVSTAYLVDSTFNPFLYFRF